jgi:hypothetical protein
MPKIVKDGVKMSNKIFGQVIFQVVLAITVLLMAACATTQENYTYPTSSEGKACVSQCDVVKMQCEQMQTMKYDNCKQQEQLENERWKQCLNEKRYDPWKICLLPSSGNCGFEPDISNCKSQWKSCFQMCGGVITIVK